MTNPGFYKFTDDVLRYAANSVYAPNFTLLAADYESYTYPVYDWHWLDSQDEAEAFFEINGQTSAQWVDFGYVVMDQAEIKALLNQAIAIGESPLAMGLAVGLGKAADGDPRVFLGAWGKAVAGGLVPAELIAQVQAMAATYYLPAEFIAGLAGAPSIT